MVRKKKKKDSHNFVKYFDLLDHVLDHSSSYYIPNNKPITHIDSHSWFSYKQHINDHEKFFEYKVNDVKESKITRADKYNCSTDPYQFNLLLRWMNDYRVMYNRTLKLFKNVRYHKSKIRLDFKRLRTDYLKDDMIEIQNKYQNKKEKINSHILTMAIQDACTSYKSCLTNLRNGNIKHFRLRYLKETKQNLILKVEKHMISKDKNTFCSSAFPNGFTFDNAFNLKNAGSAVMFHYNRATNKLSLFNAIKENSTIKKAPDSTVSLDPGVRDFLTGYSKKKVFSMGSNMRKEIGRLLLKIDHIKQNERLSQKKIKKAERKYYNKIENYIDDLHWKCIKNLTDDYNKILIGNLSTKGIISRDNGLLDSMTKRIAQFMSLFKFKQRLDYKCKQRQIYFMEIDEAYTSKTCSNCGILNFDLGSSKTFNCEICEQSIDRDLNGAKNILLKWLPI
jgi:transposase